MLLSSLLLTPILGVLAILINRDNGVSLKNIKFIALTTSILNFFISLIIFILFDFSTNQFQFVQEYHEVSYFDFYLGVDGLSIYFILLTTIIIPISLVSNWKSITKDVESYVIIILLLETLLLAVFLVLDILLFYIFFESILPPLFILIGIFGSDNRVKASFYLFLYTLTKIFNLYFQCKRAKFRGSPKALVTKVIKETFLLAPLMTGGMVTSLKISVMKWAIADLNQTLSVKEQRVDGSSKSRNLDFVRCTLVAGKPVLGRKIPFHPNNCKVVTGLSWQRAFIHTTKSIGYNLTLSKKVNNIFGEQNSNIKLNPLFVTGFVDAEGCFAIGLFLSSNYKMGYQTQAIFKITLHKKDFNLLSQIKDYFGVGTITKHGITTIEYRVKSLKDLSVVLSHFEKYPLISQKWSDCELFKLAILLLKNKEHLTEKGFNQILAIKSSMNKGLSDELQLVFPQITPVNRPLLLDKDVKDPYWLTGFTSGEGSLFFCLHT